MADIVITVFIIIAVIGICFSLIKRRRKGCCKEGYCNTCEKNNRKSRKLLILYKIYCKIYDGIKR